MDTTHIRAATISTDESYRAMVREAAVRSEQPTGAPLEIAVPITEVADEHLRALRDTDPELIFLDLDPDPLIGLKFAHFLAEQAPTRRVIATGPMLSQEMLLQALRSGIGDYLPKPVAREALDAAMASAVRRVRWSPNASPAQPGRLFAIFSPKGGSGSTTVATNLAIHLHRLTGKRTLLVDLDLELGEIALQLNVEPRFNFIDMIRNFHRMDADLLASFIERHDSGVHLLSAPYHPQKAEMVTGDSISKILNFLKQHYDYVIVDTSKSFSPPTRATFEQADQIYLVTSADLPSLRNIARCLPLLKQMAADESRLHLILNRYQDDEMIGRKDIERTLGLNVFWTVANDYDAVMGSINSGVPLILSGESKYAADIRALGAEIAGLRAEPVKTARGFPALTGPLTRMVRRALARDPEATV